MQAAQRATHPHAHAFDHVGVQPLFEGVFRQGQYGLAEVDRLTGQLVAGGANDGLGIGQVTDECGIGRCLEEQIVVLAPSLGAVNDHRSVALAQRFFHLGAEQVLPFVEIGQQVLALRGRDAQDLIPHQRPDDPRACVFGCGRIEAGNQDALRLTHQIAIAHRIARTGQAQFPGEVRFAVGNDADMIETQARDAHGFGRPQRPGLGVGDHDIGAEMRELVHQRLHAVELEQ